MDQGIDVLIAEGFRSLKSRRVGVVCHQASLSRNGEHLIDLLLRASVEIGAVFGPQHGPWGTTQDNVVEWEGYIDPQSGIRYFSLYGTTREPLDSWLNGLDILIFDLFDVGARFYTFIWTLALCMKACERVGIPLILLDRANPIGGAIVQGNVGDGAFASFVGLHPLPIRHGMTIGEIATYFRASFYPQTDLTVVRLSDWNRKKYGDEAGSIWAMPSPNMPTLDTAIVYPGGCLLEGTNLSEGRGTTRPFEIFGAPFIDGRKLALKLREMELPGVRFRPYTFQPTFQKFAGENCQGVFVDVLDRLTFDPVLAYTAALICVRQLWPNEFAWRQLPYEYEYEKPPIDILFGTDWVRNDIINGADHSEIARKMASELAGFEPQRASNLIYD